MAMPSSGCIALRNCITGCACSSIFTAVYGVLPLGNVSLLSVSIDAGMTPTYCMRNFYGYSSSYNVDVSIYNNYTFCIQTIEGHAYLRCFNTGSVICNRYIYMFSYDNWNWNNVSGCLYVDMSSVCAYDYAWNCIPNWQYTLCWEDSYNMGTGTATDPFNNTNSASFYYNQW